MREILDLINDKPEDEREDKKDRPYCDSESTIHIVTILIIMLNWFCEDYSITMILLLGDD